MRFCILRDGKNRQFALIFHCAFPSQLYDLRASYTHAQCDGHNDDLEPVADEICHTKRCNSASLCSRKHAARLARRHGGWERPKWISVVLLEASKLRSPTSTIGEPRSRKCWTEHGLSPCVFVLYPMNKRSHFYFTLGIFCCAALLPASRPSSPKRCLSAKYMK